jgi:hypothetical protein
MIVLAVIVWTLVILCAVAIGVTEWRYFHGRVRRRNLGGRR